MKEYKIGKHFTHDGVEFEVLESDNCYQCEMNRTKSGRGKYICISFFRTDGKEVIFKKVEKEGK